MKIATYRYTLEQRDKFKEKLKHRHRFFPVGGPDLHRLKERLEYLITSAVDIPSRLYRARAQEGIQQIKNDEIFLLD